MAKVYTAGVDLLAFDGRAFISHVVASNTATDAQSVILHDSTTDDNAFMTISILGGDTKDIGAFDVQTGLWIEHSTTGVEVTVVIA